MRARKALRQAGLRLSNASVKASLAFARREKVKRQRAETAAKRQAA